MLTTIEFSPHSLLKIEMLRSHGIDGERQEGRRQEGRP